MKADETVHPRPDEQERPGAQRGGARIYTTLVEIPNWNWVIEARP